MPAKLLPRFKSLLQKNLKKIISVFCAAFLISLLFFGNISLLNRLSGILLGSIVETINGSLGLEAQNDPIFYFLLYLNFLSVSILTAFSVGQTFQTLRIRTGSMPSFTGRVFFLFLPVFTNRAKKEKPWGVVYDSVTKQPIDPAMVTISVHENGVGEFKQTRVTDIQGRFSFLITPGRYVITAEKTNYLFPSSIIKGAQDGKYKNVYHGEVFEVENPYIVNLNIPMDPQGFDWNQSIKGGTPQRVLELLNENKRSILIGAGLLSTVLIYLFLPMALTLLVGGFYAFNMLFIKTYIEQKLWGTVIYRITKEPAPRLIIKAIRKPFNLTVAHTTSDHLGRYFLLLAQGAYTIQVELPKDDGTTEILKKVENINVTKKKEIINFDIGV